MNASWRVLYRAGGMVKRVICGVVLVAVILVGLVAVTLEIFFQLLTALCLTVGRSMWRRSVMRVLVLNLDGSSGQPAIRLRKSGEKLSMNDVKTWYHS